MSPSPKTQTTPWWQTVLVTVANAGIAVLVNRYLGAPAAGASLVGGTAVAHLMPSPIKK